MTVAELIRKLQNLDVDPDAPINFIVNTSIFNKKVDYIAIAEYNRIMSDGSWKLRKEVDFYLQ